MIKPRHHNGFGGNCKPIAQVTIMKNDINIRKNQFFASCPKGLEQLLMAELKEIGIDKLLPTVGGVEFECKTQMALKAILYSRLASRIFMQLFDFDVKKEKDFYFEAKKYDWKKLFKIDETFKVQALLGNSPNQKKRSHFTNSMYVGLQIKDAIVDTFREQCNDRPNVNPDNPHISLLVHVAPYDNPYSTKEKVIVSLDLCGDALSNRGYRLENFTAPLRENLAAALVQLSKIKNGKPVIDAMTGSGTFIIEAAMALADIPPSIIKVKEYVRDGYLPWSFLEHNFYTRDSLLKSEFKKLVDEIITKNNKLDGSKLPYLQANDLDYENLKIARTCMERVGVDQFIKLTDYDITKMSPDEKLSGGTFFCNPPYGERLGENADLEKLYTDIGENLKHNFKGFNAFVFTGNLPLIKKIQLRTSSKEILFNGNIECRLANYQLY